MRSLVEAKVGEITMDNELLYSKIAAMEAAPFGAQEVETMSQTLSPSCSLLWSGACARVWSISRASVYRALKETQPTRHASPWSGRRMFGR